MIEKENVQPNEILVTTFTDKASLELKDRIQKKVPQINVELMQVSTIHSFCSKILRKYNRFVNMPSDFKILNDQEQLLFLFSHSDELGFNHSADDDQYSFFSGIQRTFNLATEELVEPSSLESWCQSNLESCSAKDADLWRDRSLMVSAYSIYLKLLKANGLVDFGLLQSYALNLMQGNPAALADIKRHYPELLVDEYQDTNAAQDRILCLLAGDGNHFTAVGDDDQSIYRFRGATVRNILTFPDRFPGTKIVKLESNFRSTKPIVQNSQQVIIRNSGRISKNLTSIRGLGSDVLLVYRRTFAEEAKASVDLLKRLHKAGKIAHYGDISILLRSVKFQAFHYINALHEAGIPFDIIGDADFFKRPEISRLYDLFRFLNISGQWGDRYLQNPLLGSRPETYSALEKNNKKLIEITNEDELRSMGIGDDDDLRRLLYLISLKHQVQGENKDSMLSILYGLLNCTNCACRFEEEDNKSSMANLGLLSQIVSTWDEYGDACNFKSFFRYLALLKQGGVETVTVSPRDRDAIQVMSIHQAKGLEFPVVVMGSVVNGRLPLCPHQDPLDIPYNLRASGLPEVEDPHLVDERKLFYVAATRARDLLIIGTADETSKCGDGPSIFLQEMFGEKLQSVADLTKAYVEEVESRPRPNNIKTRHSFSELAYFLQCPVRYKYAIKYRFHVPWMESIGLGENVHRVLEEIHNRAIGGLATAYVEIPEIVAAKWVHVNPAMPEQEQELMNTATKQISRYISEHSRSLSKVLKAEANFSFDLDGQIVLGKIDLLKRDDNGSIELVDFKTSKMPVDDVGLKAERIDLQLDLYALGAEKALGLKVAKTTAHFLADGKLQTTEWSEDRKSDAVRKLVNILSCLEKDEYSPNHSYCGYCWEFGKICPHRGSND